jgi:hypothetical protein
MWFLKGRPTKISITGLVESLPKGYQQTSIRFNIESETPLEKMWMAIAFPWAAHKENGSLKFNNYNLLSLIEENLGNFETAIPLNDNIQIYPKPRALKSLPEIELIHVQEMTNWYIEDFGIMTFYIEPGKLYELNYTHKIDPDSCLFFPSRLPTVIGNREFPKICKLWIVNGRNFEENSVKILPVDSKLLQLLKETQETLDCIQIPNDKKVYDWSEDTRVHTFNWDSSDDEFEEFDEA